MDMIVTFSEAVANQIKKTIKKRVLTGFHPIPSENEFEKSNLLTAKVNK